jgi:hypothetical protein
MYVLYDYSNSLHFYDRVLPAKISEAGNTVIEAHVESVTQPREGNSGLLHPLGGHGVRRSGRSDEPALAFSHFRSKWPHIAEFNIEPVIVHGVMTPDGQIGEAEVLQNANTTLAQSALDVVKNWPSGRR